MAWDEASAAVATRVTARVSALVFAGYLATHAGRAWLPSGSRHRLEGIAPRIFAIFVLAHTVHFSAVGALTVATGGANVAARGGPAAVSAVGILFYLAALVVWRAERRLAADGGGKTTRALGWTRVVAVTLIWAAFVQAYASRLSQSVPFAGLTLLLLICFVGWLASSRASRRGPPPAAQS